MTRVSVAFLVLLSASVCAVAAANEPAPTEDAQTPAWTVVVDPLTFALGFAHVQIERTLSPHVSVYAGPHARLFDSVLGDEREDFLGLGVELGVRWFFSPGAPEGAWVGVRGVGARLTADTEAGAQSTFGGYGSVLVGYTWLATDWLVLSGGGGAQYLHYTIAGLGPKGFFPALHTVVGVAF